MKNAIISFLKTLNQYPSWAKSSVIFSIINLWVILSLKSNLWFSVIFYIWGTLTTVYFFYLYNLFQNKLPLILKYISCTLWCIYLLIVCIANYFLFAEFGYFLNPSMLDFITSDLSYISNYITTYLSLGLVLLGCISLSLFMFIWFPKKEKSNNPTSFFLKTCITISVLLFIYNLELLRQNTKLHHLPMIPATLTSIAELSINKLSHRTMVIPKHNSTRLTINKSIPDSQKTPNILIILNESFGKNQGLPFYGHSSNSMPFLTSQIKKHPNNWLVFKHAFTNSTATDVSVPSMLTGVGPFESGSKLHKMPLIWDWGKGKNKQTFLLTSHRYSWANFDNFFFTKSLDTYLDGPMINAPVINDLGIDDTIMIQELPNILSSIDAEKNGFIGVINTNALHAPYQQTSVLFTPPATLKTPYLKAQYILDQTIKKTFSYINNYLENTIIIITSDHGEESIYNHPKSHRIYSFYDSYFSIPFLIYVPEKWSKNNPKKWKNLQDNQNKNIQNLDIIPTIISLLELDKINSKILSNLVGNSLTETISINRPIIGLNTNDIRWWDQEGLGIAINSKRLMASNIAGILLTDISIDPKQEKNIWKSTLKNNPEITQSFLRIINQNHYLNRIWEMSQ